MISRREFLYVAGAAVAVSSLEVSKCMAAVQLPEPDHIILGCKDLDDGIAYMEKLSGYQAAIGGSHPGRGTRNALLKLGHKSYFEILAPDPAQTELKWHKDLATLEAPILVGWAVAIRNIEQYATHLREHGVACIGPAAGSRVTPAGETLKWKRLVLEDDKQGNLPFYIEWAPESVHPSVTAPGECVLERWSRTGELAEAPAPGPEYRPTRRSDLPDVQLHAYISGKHGEFELKSQAVPSEAWSKPQP